MGIGGRDEGKEVRCVVEDRIKGQAESLDGTSDDLALDCRENLDGDLIHLVPEVLAAQALKIHGGDVPESRRARPFGEALLAGRMTSPADAYQFQRSTDAEAIMTLRAPAGIRNVSWLSSISPARGGQVTIDGPGDIEFPCQGVDRRRCAMRLRAQPQMLSCLKASEQVVGFAKMGDDEDTGLAIHATGFDDAPIAVTSNANALDACHSVSIYILRMASQEARTAKHPRHNKREVSVESMDSRMNILFVVSIYETEGEKKSSLREEIVQEDRRDYPTAVKSR